MYCSSRRNSWERSKSSCGQGSFGFKQLDQLLEIFRSLLSVSGSVTQDDIWRHDGCEGLFLFFFFQNEAVVLMVQHSSRPPTMSEGLKECFLLDCLPPAPPHPLTHFPQTLSVCVCVGVRQKRHHIYYPDKTSACSRTLCVFVCLEVDFPCVLWPPVLWLQSGFVLIYWQIIQGNGREKDGKFFFFNF